ncbi:MAG: response regulator [Gammaproteobacteria bacterium]|nr:response regulator [Gammaproteobacteria bacterium]
MVLNLDWLQLGPIPPNAIHGSYNIGLVVLSYLIAVLASYVTLDLAARIRSEKVARVKFLWLLGGAFAMGAGIWSMHFIGMLAFSMPMPMQYEITWTMSSLMVAILASAFALFLLRKKDRRVSSMVVGGVFLGLGIVTMHYMGMEGMTQHVNIRYLPGLFLLSILIAILASEAALWLSLQTNLGPLRQIQLKIVSALIMGAAICGMHYTGMAAAIFTPLAHASQGKSIEPSLLAFYVAGITAVIITIALLLSTYRQSTVDTIQNERNFLNAMLDNLEDGIIATDANGKITMVNRTLQKKLKLSQELFKNLSDYFHPSKDDAIENSQEASPFIRALQGEKVSAVELTMGLDSSDRDNIVMNSQPIIDAQGEKLGSVIVIHNITDRIRVEKLKNEFVSTVSHELRTPLTSIRGSLGLAIGGATGELNKKTKDMLEIAYNNCQRLIRLINDILDIEKIEAGKMEFDLHPLPIATVVENAILANQAFGQKFNIKIQLEGEIPDVTINVDGDRLEQVMTNLISNAVKFSPVGGVVTVRVMVIDKWVKVCVEDKGKGISEEFQTLIFQKFAQADSSAIRHKGGTGLGLSISKTIIEKLGGKLSFTTRENEGSIFYFQLPIWHEIVISSAEKKSPAILLCEDDKDIIQLLTKILTKNNFEVDVAVTIVQAKQLLKTKHYHAMTLDLVLPDGDGIPWMQELRKDPRYSELPIILISGKVGAKEDLLNGHAFSIINWVNNTFDETQLINAIKQIKKKLIGAKPSILHIEDDQDLLKIVANMLQEDATLESAHNLHEAQSLLSQQKFDLVLLDLILPDGSGIELLPQLCSLHIPVIVFTAFELPRDYVRYVSAALIKSRITDKELLTVIKEAINKLGEENEGT